MKHLFQVGAVAVETGVEVAGAVIVGAEIDGEAAGEDQAARQDHITDGEVRVRYK